MDHLGLRLFCRGTELVRYRVGIEPNKIQKGLPERVAPGVKASLSGLFAKFYIHRVYISNVVQLICQVMVTIVASFT